jgi:hypothetical protein
MIGQQIKDLIDGMGTTAVQVLGNGTLSGPSFRPVYACISALFAVYACISALFALHSLIHVLFVHLISTMILDRMYDAGQMERRSKLVPFFDWLKDHVNSSTIVYRTTTSTENCQARLRIKTTIISERCQLSSSRTASHRRDTSLEEFESKFLPVAISF